MNTTQSLHKKWSKFLSARKTGVKRAWKPLLEERINEIESLNEHELRNYIESLCTAYFDEGLKIPIQHPQIWEKILENWKENLKSPDVKHLLWAYKAHFHRDVYQLLGMEDYEILDKVIEISPGHKEAERLIFKNRLDMLDYAIHELPRGLLIDESICLSAIERCENMARMNPELLTCRSRFNIDLAYYKKVLFSWLEYESSNIQQDFYEWMEDNEK